LFSLRFLKQPARGLMLWFSLSVASMAAVPVPTDVEEARARLVAEMPDETPSGRINQLLAARNLNRAERFALAATQPGIVEQLLDPRYQLATNYLFSLRGVELHQIREGRTLIRPVRALSQDELKAIDTLCSYFGLDIHKLRSVHLGPHDGQVYRLEVTLRGKKKKQTVSRAIEIAWPPTPTRDEASRTALTIFFDARPSRKSVGSGSTLPLQNGSFEAGLASWQVVPGTSLGHHQPAQEVTTDAKTALDGSQSLRFYATERTRQFFKVQQTIPATPGTRIRLRSQLKAELIRIEFLQKRSDFYMGLTFLGPGRQPIGPSFSKAARTGSHPWELLEITQAVPPGAVEVEVSLVSSMSGTAWYDGVILEVVQ